MGVHAHSGMCTEKNRTVYQSGAEKIAFLPTPDIRRTDISNYRVASLLKKGVEDYDDKKLIKYIYQLWFNFCFVSDYKFI